MSMQTLLPLVKLDNGIPSAQTGYDSLLTMLVQSAQADMIRAGVASADAAALTDADVCTAVMLYVKGHFGLTPDEKYLGLYEDALKRLGVSGSGT